MLFVEHSGAAIGAGRQSILDLEERMRQTGAELLVLKPGDVTATQVQSENEANRCALQRIVEDFEDSLDQCLQFMAMWVGEQQGGHVTMFKDFGAANLAEASAELLLKSNQAGKLSDETYFGELKRRGIVAPDATWEDEQEKISEQGPALGMVGNDPAGNDPVVDPVADPVQQNEPIDLSPVLDAIAAIEKPEPSDDSAIKSAIANLATQLSDLSAQVAEPQTAEIDLSPINDAIANLADKVASLEKQEPEDSTDEVRKIVADSIAPLLEKIAALSTKPEPKEPDLESLRNNIMRDVTAIVTQMQANQQPQPIVILDGQGQVKKQITIQKDAKGNITGAISEPQSIN